MPAGPERRETNRLIKDVRAWDPKAFVWKVYGGPYRGGIPDLCIIVKGITWWIEMKVHPRKITPKQQDTIERMADAGAHVCVMTVKEELPGRLWDAVVEVYVPGGLYALNFMRRRGEAWDLGRILALLSAVPETASEEPAGSPALPGSAALGGD